MPLQEGIDLSGYTHLYSKVDKAGTTTLETEITGKIIGADVRLVGKLYTRENANPVPPDAAGAQDASSLSEERRAELTNDYWINLLLTLGAVKLPAAQAEPETGTEPAEAGEPEAEPEQEEELGTLEETAHGEETLETQPAAEPTPGSLPEPAEEIVEDVDLDEEGA